MVLTIEAHKVLLAGSLARFVWAISVAWCPRSQGVLYERVNNCNEIIP
jgi:hypothetical protein